MKFWKLIILTLFLGTTVLAQTAPQRTYQPPRSYQPQGSTQSSERTKELIEFDISGSAGNHDGQSYTELHAGVNLNFTDSFTWRNSLFKRIPAGGGQEVNGLDSTLRLSHDIGPLTVYAGPGYRWTNVSNKNALLGEAGANLNMGRLTLGAGAKYLLYDQAQFDSAGNSIKREDLSYFIVISGGFGASFGLGK